MLQVWGVGYRAKDKGKRANNFGFRNADYVDGSEGMGRKKTS